MPRQHSVNWNSLPSSSARRRRNVIVARDSRDDVPYRDRLALIDSELSDDPVTVRCQLVLHFHRFDDANEISGVHLLARLHGDTDHCPLHRADECLSGFGG